MGVGMGCVILTDVCVEDLAVVYSGSLALPFQEFAESSVWKGNIVKCIYQPSTLLRKKKKDENKLHPIEYNQEKKHGRDSIQLHPGSLRMPGRSRQGSWRMSVGSHPGSLKIMGGSKIKNS